MKRFLSIVLSAILVLSIIPISTGFSVSAAPAVIPVFSVQQVQSADGKLVVEFKLDSGVFNSLDIKFEPSSGLSCAGIQLSAACKNNSMSSANVNPGEAFNVSMTSADGYGIKGTIFTVTYNISGIKRDEYSVKFSIEDCSVTVVSEDDVQNVKVNPDSPVFTKKRFAIAVTSMPTKTVYCKGTGLDKSGLVVTAYYLNGSSKKINDYSLHYDFSTAGKKTVNVSYTYDNVKAETQFEITVNEHIPNEGKVEKQVSCTEDGLVIYHCTQCGKLCKEEVITAKGHEIKLEIIKLPTYNSTGLERMVCDVCGHIEEEITTPVLNPDIDADGLLSSGDALVILQHATGLVTLGGDALRNADLDGSGKVESKDALVVLQLATNLLT